MLKVVCKPIQKGFYEITFLNTNSTSFKHVSLDDTKIVRIEKDNSLRHIFHFVINILRDYHPKFPYVAQIDSKSLKFI